MITKVKELVVAGDYIEATLPAITLPWGEHVPMERISGIVTGIGIHNGYPVVDLDNDRFVYFYQITKVEKRSYCLN